MATALGLLAILLWGLLALFSVYSKEIAPFQLLALCFFIASSLVYLNRFLKREKLFVRPSLTLPQWLVGVFGLFGFHFCYFMGFRYAPAMEVSTIAYLWPLLLGIYVAPSNLYLRAVLGGALGFLGVLVLIQEQITNNFSYTNIIGYVFAFACALIWSAYSWFISVHKSNTADITWLTLLSGILALIAHLLLEETNWSFSSIEWLSIIFLGLGPVGGAFYLWEIGMKSGNTSLLASFSFFTPVISAFALYIYGEASFSSYMVVALSMILAGAAITNSKRTVLRPKERQAS